MAASNKWSCPTFKTITFCQKLLLTLQLLGGIFSSCQTSWTQEDTKEKCPHSLHKALVISASKLVHLKFGRIGVPEENHRAYWHGPSAKWWFWVNDQQEKLCQAITCSTFYFQDCQLSVASLVYPRFFMACFTFFIQVKSGSMVIFWCNKVTAFMGVVTSVRMPTKIR